MAIVLALLGALTAINAAWPTALDRSTPIGGLLAPLVETFLDLPVFKRAADAGEQGTGYSYFETDGHGQLIAGNAAGRLKGQAAPLTLAQLRVGDKLIAADDVNIRATGTSSANLVGVIGGNACVKVTSLPTDPSAAGGWIGVVKTDCK